MGKGDWSQLTTIQAIQREPPEAPSDALALCSLCSPSLVPWKPCSSASSSASCPDSLVIETLHVHANGLSRNHVTQINRTHDCLDLTRLVVGPQCTLAVDPAEARCGDPNFPFLLLKPECSVALFFLSCFIALFSLGETSIWCTGLHPF